MSGEKELIEVPKDAKYVYLITETAEEISFELVKGRESEMTEIMFGYGWIASAIKRLAQNTDKSPEESQLMFKKLSALVAEQAF